MVSRHYSWRGIFFHRRKKIGHRIEAGYSAGDDVFARTMGQLLGPPLLKGNKVTVFENGEQIFPALLEGIRSAERTITFENFLWDEGEVTDAFAAALIERARAGVKVHFLQDALGCDHLRGRAMNALRRSPVELEIFRFLKLIVNFRTHRKLLVIDGKTGFIGGTGISDSWKGNGRTPGLWRDSHYRVEGPAVAQMQQAFMDNWLQTRAWLLHGDAYFPELKPVGNQMCQVFKSSAGEGSDSARLMLLVSIASARRTHSDRERVFHPRSPLHADAARGVPSRSEGGDYHPRDRHRCATGARRGEDALATVAGGGRTLLRISACAFPL